MTPKQWILLLIVVVLLGGVTYYALRPPAPAPEVVQQVDQTLKAAQEAEAAKEAARKQQAAEIDRKLAEMQPRYQELDRVRKEVKTLHDRLSRRFRRQTVPAESVQDITKTMSEASYLLRNPQQIGAFKTPDEIVAKTTEFQQILERLRAIDAQVPEQK